MNFNKKTVRDIDVRGKKVLIRCDFNTPIDENGHLTDERRIQGALPTLRYLITSGAAVIVVSHLGRPKGQYNPKYTLKPVANRLSELLKMPVTLANDVIGEDADRLCAAIQPGEIVMLENVRFHKEEEKNDPAFSQKLASYADVYVNDAFGTSHRAHSSTAGVAAYLPAVCGFLIEKEISVIGKALTNPARPFVAITGGAKVSDKIGVINNLLQKADTILIGGGMAYTFQVALGRSIGTSLLDAGHVNYARDMSQKAKAMGVTLLLPQDNLATQDFSADAQPVLVEVDQFPENLMGMDIGPKTIEAFTAAIQGAGTVVWNGPMGVFEFPAFAKGTNAIAGAMAQQKDAITIVGGGDSASAVEQSGMADQFTHISTGGGASLEFLEGLTLPGIACLEDK